MLKFIVIVHITVVALFAGWVFVNDDGTFSPYEAEEDIYVIPNIEPSITKPLKIIKKKKKIVTQKQVKNDIKKIMYLTFDDGPLAGTRNVIEILLEENIPATMFMVGKHIQKNIVYRDAYQIAIDEPTILVANHTYCHANGRYRHFYSYKEALLKDMQKMDTLLARDDVYHDIRYARLAGRNVFRLPKMRYDDRGIKKKYGESTKYDALYDEGYYLYGWDYQWSYNPKSGRVNKTAEVLVRNIERIYKRGRIKHPNKFILLMHDFSFQDRFHGKKSLKKLIHLLEEKGWSFETLETYI